jgi:hypothetical protein
VSSKDLRSSNTNSFIQTHHIAKCLILSVEVEDRSSLTEPSGMVLEEGDQKISGTWCEPKFSEEATSVLWISQYFMTVADSEPK